MGNLFRLMFNKIYIIDFEDSFTYNIASELYSYEKKLKVIPHRQFFETEFLKLVSSKFRCAVILGPGPGHPIQYKYAFSKINKLIKSPNIYLMGICLGHQLIGSVLGHKIVAAKKKLHGRTCEINFKMRKQLVQHYNSLAVMINENECPILHLPNGITYQFHPESIGTMDSELYFRDLLMFLNTDS